MRNQTLLLSEQFLCRILLTNGMNKSLQWKAQMVDGYVYYEQTSVEWTLTAVVTGNVGWSLTSLIHSDNASVSRDGSETGAIKVRFRWIYALLNVLLRVTVSCTEFLPHCYEFRDYVVANDLDHFFRWNTYSFRQLLKIRSLSLFSAFIIMIATTFIFYITLLVHLYFIPG